MSILLIIALIGIALFTYITEKKIYNLLTVFCCLWLIITIISIIRPYNMYPTSEEAYMTILIGTLGFFVGFYFRKRKKIVIKKRTQTENAVTYIPRKNVITILACFCAVYGCVKLIAVLRLVGQGYLFSNVRELFSAGDAIIIHGTVDNVLNVFVYGSGTTVLAVLLVASIFKSYMSKVDVFFSIIAIATYAIISGGRYIFISLIVDAIYLMIISKKTKQAIEMIKRQRRKLLVVLIVAIAAVSFITNMRFGSDFENRNISATSQYLLYFSGCMPLMSHWIDVINRNNYCTFGITSIHGFIHALSLITRLIGIQPGALYNMSSYLIDTEFQSFVYVAQDRAMNTFTSIFTYLYLDAGEIGVFIGMLVYGYWCEHCYINVIKHQNIRNVLFFLLMLYSFSQSMIRWPFYKGTFVMAIVYVLLIVKKSRTEKEER